MKRVDIKASYCTFLQKIHVLGIIQPLNFNSDIFLLYLDKNNC
jgi:hypothetical protein